MPNKSIFGLLIAWLLCGFTMATSQESRWDAHGKSDQLLIQRIQAGDGAAIAEAGKSGNKLFIPYLKKELTDRRNLGTSLSPIGSARVALAKLGETDQMQEVWCRA